MAVIGIDLGTTNSLAGVWQDGKVVLIPNAFGEYLTPSVVGIGKNQEVFVGSVAKEMLATQPYDTFREFKRNMGTNFLLRMVDSGCCYKMRSRNTAETDVLSSFR